MELDGQVAIVTGGSRGYGYGIAESLCAAGAEVWITGRGEAALQAAAEKIGVKSVVADVTVAADWDRVFETVLGEKERLDILINNAGAGRKEVKHSKLMPPHCFLCGPAGANFPFDSGASIMVYMHP